MIGFIVLGIIVGFIIWKAYGIGKMNGREEQITINKLNHDGPWSLCVGKRLWEAAQAREFWHGKWTIVKHENNELRKQVRKLRKAGN